MIDEIISGGSYSPIIYEMRITASELDIMLLALEHEKARGNDIFTETKERLLKELKLLSEIRQVRSLRKYGYMDESRLNWK